MTINVLGTIYHLQEKTSAEDEFLISCDGYCDKTSKKIVIKKENIDLDNFDVYKKKIYRHEIIHAFLFESGLAENFRHSEWGHDETFIDWFAYQSPKIFKAFKEAECL